MGVAGIYIVLFVLAGIGAGVLFGRAAARSEAKVKVERAYSEGIEAGKKEFESEKLNLSVDLHKQLGKIRESLLDSAKAYESAVRTVDDRLAVPADVISKKLGGPVEKQLQLELRESSSSEGKEALEAAKGPVKTGESIKTKATLKTSEKVDTEAPTQPLSVSASKVEVNGNGKAPRPKSEARPSS